MSVRAPPTSNEVLATISAAAKSGSNAEVLSLLRTVVPSPEVLSVVFLAQPDSWAKTNKAGKHGGVTLTA